MKGENFYDLLKSSGELSIFVRHASNFTGYELVKLFEDDPFKAFYDDGFDV